MDWIVKNLWLIPALPVLAAGLSSLAPQRCRKFSASLAIGSMVVAFLLSLCAFAHTLGHHGEDARQVFNFRWFQFGSEWLKLGWVLDPLTAVMLVMVTFVGTLIFIYSTGYMAHDENFTRFFTFLSLFAGAMLGVIIANSLLLLFISWELVGLTSYLLIGFWYHKPSAAAAAKKAFITTRIGDVAFLLGMVWLYSQTGTLLFYDNGTGCLEQSALGTLVAKTTFFGMAVSTAIGLLIFAGAVGKSGQVPLHVWLPDAMEGPTPVSALIHAATMVAAGVFLVARVYPLMSGFNPFLHPAMICYNNDLGFSNNTTTLQVITWVGAITAVFAASIAVAQNDIKRILAYSTVSQLGYMMMGLGTGGVAVGMFHLITHAFFKALLFMGAGSVIHGCHEEQDIRHMGGIRKFMPVTFYTYGIGMLALCGFPLFFSGFWSKDEILHAAHGWRISQIPFYLGLFGALLTAFYMTRQMALVFFGKNRAIAHAHDSHGKHEVHTPHESPLAMTAPLGILAACAIALGFIGTPAWPWFQDFLEKRHAEVDFGKFSEGGVVPLMLASSVIVIGSMVLGWWLYGRKPITKASDEDVLKKARPDIYWLLENKYFIDELYEATVIRFNAWFAGVCDFLDAWVWGGAVLLVSYLTIGLGWVNDSFDKFVINLGFDQGCGGVTRGGGLLSKLQDGKVQNYLRIIGGALVVLALLLIWGGGK
jgi:NADH-quinone oxidoreductase subunit L